MRFISLVMILISFGVGCKSQQIDLTPKTQSISNRSLVAKKVLVTSTSSAKTYVNIYHDTLIQNQDLYYKKNIENVCFDITNTFDKSKKVLMKIEADNDFKVYGEFTIHTNDNICLKDYFYHKYVLDNSTVEELDRSLKVTFYIGSEDNKNILNSFDWNVHVWPTTEDILYVDHASFISVWRTTLPNETITLPLRDGGSFNYNFTVDWGDGDDASLDSSSTTFIDHTYLTAGYHTVTIRGVFPAINFSDSVNVGSRLKLISIPDLGGVQWKTFRGAFWGCSNLGLVEGGDTSDVLSMVQMFQGANLVTPDTSDWDTSLVTDMSSMFFQATSANPDTSTWNTSSVEKMNLMFLQATSANPDTSGWDTSLVDDMTGMFYQATSANPDTSDWDTSLVTDMSNMFQQAISANPDTSVWDTSLVKYMSSMFYLATSADPDTSGWNTSSVEKMDGMFKQASSANPDTSGWDTSSVDDMSYMFYQATSASPDTSGWDTSSVDDMSYMFDGASNANPVMTSWHFGSITNMAFMLTGSAVSNSNYSNMLIAIAATNTTQTNVTLHGGSAQYNPAGAVAKSSLETFFWSWTIIDGGAEPL